MQIIKRIRCSIVHRRLLSLLPVLWLTHAHSISLATTQENVQTPASLSTKLADLCDEIHEKFQEREDLLEANNKTNRDIAEKIAQHILPIETQISQLDQFINTAKLESNKFDNLLLDSYTETGKNEVSPEMRQRYLEKSAILQSEISKYETSKHRLEQTLLANFASYITPLEKAMARNYAKIDVIRNWYYAEASEVFWKAIDQEGDETPKTILHNKQDLEAKARNIAPALILIAFYELRLGNRPASKDRFMDAARADPQFTRLANFGLALCECDGKEGWNKRGRSRLGVATKGTGKKGGYDDYFYRQCKQLEALVLAELGDYEKMGKEEDLLWLAAFCNYRFRSAENNETKRPKSVQPKPSDSTKVLAKLNQKVQNVLLVTAEEDWFAHLLIGLALRAEGSAENIEKGHNHLIQARQLAPFSQADVCDFALEKKDFHWTFAGPNR